MHSWEPVQEPVAHDGACSGAGVDEDAPAVAVELTMLAFIGYFLDLTDESTISVKEMCVLLCTLRKLRKPCEVRRIGFRLDAPRGHYQWHMDAAPDVEERQGQFL